jgi:hypothetical protein
VKSKNRIGSLVYLLEAKERDTAINNQAANYSYQAAPNWYA